MAVYCISRHVLLYICCPLAKLWHFHVIKEKKRQSSQVGGLAWSQAWRDDGPTQVWKKWGVQDNQSTRYKEESSGNKTWIGCWDLKMRGPWRKKSNYAKTIWANRRYPSPWSQTSAEAPGSQGKKRTTKRKRAFSVAKEQWAHALEPGSQDLSPGAATQLDSDVALTN